MEPAELIKAVRWLEVETGSLACLGCGYEHSCGVYRCRILREVEVALETMANERRNAADDVPGL